MADKPKDKKGGDKKPSDSKTDTLGIVLLILLGLAVASALVGSFQDRFAGGGRIEPDTLARRGVFFLSSRVSEYTDAGTLVETKRTTDVWASSLRDRILGVQERGARGRLVESEIFTSDVWWNVDFETAPDGWVSADGVRKVFEGTVARVRVWLLWVSGILSILGAFVALYSWRRWMLVTAKHRLQMKQLEEKLVEKSISNKNERWDKVRSLVSSSNPGDWRVAILEADVMLDELVSAMGYHGDTLGEKLKMIEKSDFETIDDAWEAHKVRNRIAHHGSDFILTHREAQRVIGLFGKVFEEFEYI